MKRKLLEKLILWKNKSERVPLLLLGAKCTGKTYIAFEFSETFYSQRIYINLERDYNIRSAFLGDDYINILDTLIRNYMNEKDLNRDDPILIILDEIMYCKESFIFALKARFKNVDIIMISSFYEQYIQDNKSKVELISVMPIDFREFLWATGNQWYIEVITEHFHTNKKIPDIVHRELLDLVYDYIISGGMPSVLNEYISLSSKINVMEHQNYILNTYSEYIRGLLSEGEGLKTISAYKTIPIQLSKNNRKFQYKLIRKGATRKLYEREINFLEENKFITKCRKIKEYNNIGADIEDTSFKIYLNDTGILNCMAASQKCIAYEQNSNEHYKSSICKGLLENYVIQSLTANGYTTYFWESSSQAKIDFIIEKKENEKYIPIEVYSDTKTRSKSLSILKKEAGKYLNDSIKISTRNFEYSKGIKYVPIYAVFCI